MNKLKIAATALLCLLVSVAFAQRNQDSIEVKSNKKNAESKLVSIEKETSFGYHHNNYKHHAKAKKARKWFQVRGHVNQSAKVINYKMPFTEEQKAEKTIVEETKAPRHTRNYKRPYSKN